MRDIDIMTNAILYYRTPTTRAIDAGYTTVPLLFSNAPKQCIQFSAPNNIFEGVDEDYDNMITPQPSVQPTGVRRIFIRDNGMKARSFTIRGRLLQPANDVNKLKKFRTILQQDTYHIHGCVGVYYPNAPFFSIDPASDTSSTVNADRGFAITNTRITHTGKIIQRAFFTATLQFGGTHETVTIT
jgi:hypothetical protein